MINCIPVVNDLVIKANLIQAAVTFILQPLTKHDQQVISSDKPSLRSERYGLLTKRISQLEKRQILLEAELALFRGQLDREYVPSAG